MKKIAILGATGSIGTQALKVVENLKNYEVCAITANAQIDLLEQQARAFRIPMVGVMDEEKAKELKIRLADTPTKVVGGMAGMIACSSENDAEMVLSATMGIAGLLPTVAAIKAKKTIALANKETLVAGGDYVINLAKENGVALLPVDSEHCAIFECLQGCHHKQEVKKIILTASGGPFFGRSKEELEGVTVKEALNHPNWSMGAKITIDSATLMNKGLEFIEAMRLFGVKPNQIEVVVHRESIIHSMVEYADNSIIAQLGTPDMAHPIQYALTYPNRVMGETTPLDFAKIGKMTFFKPDMETFRCLHLAIEAAKAGGSMSCVLNGANEAAVDLFLKGKITFLQIANLVEDALHRHENIGNPNIEEILACDKWARACVYESLKNIRGERN